MTSGGEEKVLALRPNGVAGVAEREEDEEAFGARRGVLKADEEGLEKEEYESLGVGGAEDAIAPALLPTFGRVIGRGEAAGGSGNLPAAQSMAKFTTFSSSSGLRG